MGNPDPSSSECCKPAPGGGCGPATAAARPSCCPSPSTPAAAPSPSCCPPKQPAATSSCCPPKQPAATTPSCCPPASKNTKNTAAAPDATGAVLPGGADAVRESVSRYYGATLTRTEDLKTSACCTKTPPPTRVRAVLSRVPAEIRDRYYGCGSPWPAGLEGRRVLDLGCGTGRDVFVAAALVGEKGSVIGVDMTPAQLNVGRRHAEAWAVELGYAKSNVRFVKGRIEELPSAPAAGGGEGGDVHDSDDDARGVPASWADVIISNCVVNLSPDKPAVLRGAFATLAPGGEMHFSDVYCSRRLARAARSHPVAVGECLGGALFADDFLALCREAGFARPRVAAAREFEVHDAELREVLGADARFYSVTYRVFKLVAADEAAWRKGGGGKEQGAAAADEDDEDDDTRVVPEDAARGFAVAGCQDFGQTAVYLGTVADHPDRFELDMGAAFERGVAKAVCCSTAAALARTWLAPHFEVTRPGPHKGAFAGCGGCGSGIADVQRLADEEEARLGGGGGGSSSGAAKGGGGKCC